MAPGPAQPARRATVLVDRATMRPSLVGTLTAVVRYRELIRNLVLKDLRIKYRGSVLGFFWSMANPLMMVAVYSLAFKYVMGSPQPAFPFFVLLGVMSWTFFASATMASTGSVVDNVSLIHAVGFPRLALPLATVIFSLIQYLLTLVVLLPVMFVFYRVPAAGPLMLFPVFLALQLACVMGVSLIVSVATAFFRDVRHFAEVALSVLFWATPIVYPLTQAPAWLQPWLLVSPMSSFVTAYQSIFYNAVFPRTGVWIGAIVWGLGTLFAGIVWFRALDRSAVERL